MAVMVLGKINTKEKENLEGLNFIKWENITSH
jgi:hypothetical protein